MMLSVSEEIIRENLYQEIIDAIREWPQRDQKIFAQAHYRGRSIEEISTFLNLNVEEVCRILQHCNHELYAALKKFRKSEHGISSLPPIQIANSISGKAVPGGCNF
jgi:DNA-directed RNA polymerase specialized sigma24 family protein